MDNVGAELSVTNRLFHMLGHSFAEAIVQEIKPLDSTKAILRFVESLMTVSSIVYYELKVFFVIILLSCFSRSFMIQMQKETMTLVNL